MKTPHRARTLAFIARSFVSLSSVGLLPAQTSESAKPAPSPAAYAALPSETPVKFEPATQRIYHAPGQASCVELPVVK